MSIDEENGGEETPLSADMPASKRARQEQLARKAAERDLRLKAQLRANLQRRKVQTRARREGEEDSRPGDLPTLREER
ncbi:hypothetical protein [Rhizobium sp. TH2]|uniref:hypothetical protein n=1 Tax=Rhizobium sp. TH2 TaxID=2775403 RepID=UPI00280B47A5|nr:hypothetical protein [Rhizobium sp. TH2]